VGQLGTSGSAAGWSYLFAGAEESYIWSESAYSALHPEWGESVYHEGKEALRTHTQNRAHTSVYQIVRVGAEQAYGARAWAKTADLHGQGFGQNSDDRVQLVVSELDQTGRALAVHRSAVLTDAAPYRPLEVEFTTQELTRSLRFQVDVHSACPYDHGHVSIDACSVEAVADREQ
jgi:hypothetical protein